MKAYLLICFLCFVTCAYCDVTCAVVSECVSINGERKYRTDRVLVGVDAEQIEFATNSVFSWGLGWKYLAVVSKSKDRLRSRIQHFKLDKNLCQYQSDWYNLEDKKDVAKLLFLLDSFPDQPDNKNLNNGK